MDTLRDLEHRTIWKLMTGNGKAYLIQSTLLRDLAKDYLETEINERKYETVQEFIKYFFNLEDIE